MNNSIFKRGLLVLGLVIFMGCGKGEKGVPPPELKDKIVFLSDEGICTINPDGTDRKVIVPSDKGGPLPNPRWSPDKREIAFTGKLKGHNRIMVVNSDGSNLKIISLPEPKRKKLKLGEKVLAVGIYDLYLGDWSPSGKYFSYSIPEIDANYVGIMNINSKIITEQYGVDIGFVSEESVIFIESYVSRTTAVGTKIINYNLKNKKKEVLTEDEGVFYYLLSISTQLDKIAYGVDSVALYNSLWIMNSNGSARKRLATQNYDFVGKRIRVIKFSPDGNKILFLPDNGYKSCIYVVNTDGTGLYAVVSEIVNVDCSADWSPDGKNIIFTSNQDGNNELYIVNINGTGSRRLTDNHINDCCPDW